MIKLSNISKSYPLDGQVFTALSNINLEIGHGELTAIMGPSGSGKSTLMHIIGLLDSPSGGKIFVDNHDVSALSDAAISKLRNEFVGFVFQQFNLLPKLTIKENILLPAIYARRKLSFVPEEKVQSLLESFGIADKINSYPNKLSGGQQQRVAIARALIMNPQLVLADEPTGNLDSKTGGEIMELLVELNRKEKVTTVIVTHEENIAKRCRRIIKIMDGQIK